MLSIGYNKQERDTNQFFKEEQEQEETKPVALSIYEGMWKLIWELSGNIWEDVDSGHNFFFSRSVNS